MLLFARHVVLGRPAILLALAVLAIGPAPASALEHVTVRDGRREKIISGEVLAEARDGVLVRSADGAFHRLLEKDILERSHDDQPLVMLTAQQLGEQLLEELPPGFQVHYSKNYVVCYNTTRPYAEWTSSLLERLQKAFIEHWKKRGCKVAPSKHPLPVIVFSDQASYAEYARPELGPAVSNVIGYYNVDSNRTVMYDLTGMQAVRRDGYGRATRHDITELLSFPAAEPLVATIVHEATHQISFNCGLQTRLSDNPLWMSEGLAVYFETPNLSSSRSWSGVAINYARWDLFVENLDAGRVPPLGRLIANDDLFRDPETAVDSYAQAWAWNYFLIKWRPKQYAAYLKAIADKPILTPPDAKQRVADFRKFFGDDFDALEDEFFRQMRRVDR
jgi:hypothetical protein